MKDQVSSWRTIWNSEVNQSSISNMGVPVPIANMVAPSQSTIPDTEAGDSIRPDIVFGIYPKDEISFHQGIGNSQKQDWEEFMISGIFNNNCESIGGWIEDNI